MVMDFLPPLSPMGLKVRLGTVPWSVLVASTAALWGLPMSVEGQQVPELSFTGAFIGQVSDVARQTCPRYEAEGRVMDKIKEGGLLALRVKHSIAPRAAATIPVDFEILSRSTADASDLGSRKTLRNVPLKFSEVIGYGINERSCHYVDIAKDLKLEGEEILSLRLTPKAGVYTVSGSGTRDITIAEDGAAIRLRYKDIGTLGAVPSERSFALQLEAGTPSNRGRSCSTFTRDSSFNRTIDVKWRILDGARADLGAASLSDFNLPERVTFRNGVADITVQAKMDGDRAAEDFTIERIPVGTPYPGIICEPASANMASGVWGPQGVITPALPTPAKPTALSASPAEDRVTLSWTAATDSTIAGWRYRLRAKGVTSWGNAVSVGSSSASTRRHQVDTSAYFDGLVSEFQVQSYNGAGDSPWSDAATATLLNRDKPALAISQTSVSVEEGATAGWTVGVNGTFAGTVTLTSSNTATVTVNPPSLTFTSQSAGTPQTVTVTGVAAGEAEVGHAFTLTGSTATTVANAGVVEVTVTERSVVAAPAPVKQFRARPGDGKVILIGPIRTMGPLPSTRYASGWPETAADGAHGA